jgi:hypothetical protein
MNKDTVFDSFTQDMFEIIDNIESIRYSKKRKIDKLKYAIDDSSTIHESDDFENHDDFEFDYPDYNKKSRQYKKYILKKM